MTPAAEGFGTRLRAAMDDRGPLCAGIDPHPGLLESWGLTDSVDRINQICGEVQLAGAVSVEAVRRRFLNGNEGYLWSSARVRYANDALLTVRIGNLEFCRAPAPHLEHERRCFRAAGTCVPAEPLHE